MTFDAFTSQMERLEGLKFGPANLHTHWEGLRDIDVSGLERAIGHALRECESYPSPAELRRFVSLTAPIVGMDEDRSVPLVNVVEFKAPQFEKPIVVTREWQYYCARCSDIGMETVWCGDSKDKHLKPWVDVFMSCGRNEEHDAHEFSRRCVCRDSNPAVLRKRERSAQQAATRTAKQDRS